MKNKLMDLNNHLFEQLERLNDEDLSGEKLDIEIKRAEAMHKVAGQIISNAGLALKAHSLINDGLIKSAPEMIGMKEVDE